jgi:dCMP deaminase
VVIDGEVTVTGWAGASTGAPTCDDDGHLLADVVLDGRHHTHCIRLIHAEQRAVAEAARTGTLLCGATFYCTMEPCRSCAMTVVAAGASRVVARRRYHAGAPSRSILAAAGVELLVWLDETEIYPHQSSQKSAAPAESSE